MRDYFASDVIGQTPVRRQLSFYLDSFYQTQRYKNILFVGPKGDGKTMFCEQIGKRLQRDYIEIHGETVGSVDDFYGEVLLPHVIDRQVTLMVDEIHCLKKPVAEFLLSILAPNSQGRNVVTAAGRSFTIDFREFTFLAATTDPQKVILPLRDRLKIITLSQYSPNELQKIIQKGAGNIFLDQTVLNFLVKYSRGNARSCIDLGEEVKTYCTVKSKQIFELQDAQELIKILDIFEFGFRRLELQILEAIYKARRASLTRLAAKSGLTSSAQRDLEREMLARDLIDIDGSRARTITNEGLQYLKRNLILL